MKLNGLRCLQVRVWFLAASGIPLVATPFACAGEGDEEITAVYSKASDDYVRAKLPSGTFRAETYAFGEGGKWGGPIVDATIDKLKFLDVARVISVPLASQNYVPSKDPKNTRLLIMVYWGTTSGTAATRDSLAYQQMQQAGAALQAITSAPSIGGAMAGAGKDALGNSPTIIRGFTAINAYNVLNQALGVAAAVDQQRDQADVLNAKMLGYDSEGLIGTAFGAGLAGTPLRFHRDDLISEIEQNRYFVVLMAYDFQLMWKQKKHKELWETRFSLRQLRHDFGKDLPSMAQYASQYFGQDSHGLVRQAIPLGHVEVGVPTSLGTEPEK
jgi:hypothetical protein